MAIGLAALLDDVAVIAKMASATSAKTAAVLVDDAAVTPQYVSGFSPARELPIIGKIAKGSLVNKAILIVLLLILDHFAPFLLVPLLMLGGLYLSFEGAEKVIEVFKGEKEDAGDVAKQEEAVPPVEKGADHEKMMVRGAITTDFILSAEIMVISLNTLNGAQAEPMGLVMKGITLVVVAIIITALVYGVVGLIVKMDDIGLKMTERQNKGSQKMGRMLVDGMPKLLAVLSAVGVVAMLWVGGHILLSGADKLGWHAPMALVHFLAEPAHHVAAVGGALAWLIDTICSAIVAFVVGSVVVGIVHLFPHKKKDAAAAH